MNLGRVGRTDVDERGSRVTARAPFLVLLVASAALSPALVGAQVPTGDMDTTTVTADPGDIVSSARAAQARFERARIRYLPLSHQPFGGSCDEIVGRFCTTYGEGEWYPLPENEAIVRLREELIAELDTLQPLAPSSGLILGQRVWYRAEAGAWPEARHVAARCGVPERWWCEALEGFALHGMGRYAGAEGSFERALTLMDGERARRWRIPRWPVDGGVRDLLEEVEDDPEREAARIARLWALADPLYLVDGNDRLTAHYARWTVSEMRERMRNPYRMSWGDDLTQLTVRHGWEVGWERTPARDFSTIDHVVGHKHPEGRDYMSEAEAVRDPARASAEDLRADRTRPRSLYAPEYAPVLLPMEGQIAVLPRGTHMVVVATHSLPEDTTLHAGHGHPVPWLEPGDQAGMPDRMGLFAFDIDSGRVRGVRSSGEVDGVSMLELPTGDYVVSAESWSPSRRRAGRLRVGVTARVAPPDIATLSDLLLLRPASTEPESLEGALDLMLPTARIRPGQTFAIGWEVAGLGFRGETLVFELSIERTDRSVLSRIGEFLRLSDGPQPLSLSWEEAGPREPGHVFRYLSLDIPALEEGEYEIRLVLKTANRSDAVARRVFEVVARQ